MKAMILAAGRGERLRPLTDTIPKPLMQIGDHSLVEWHIKRLQQAGITEIIINVSHLAEQIKSTLGSGQGYGVAITYSDEPEEALETGGGILQALPWLGNHPFVVINGDIWTDYPFEQLQQPAGLAHLVMVENPQQHPQGDFVLEKGQVLDATEGDRYTFSGIGIYKPALFSGCKPGRFPLAPLLKEAMQEELVSGELYTGHWHDVGTPGRLLQVQTLVNGKSF